MNGYSYNGQYDGGALQHGGDGAADNMMMMMGQDGMNVNTVPSHAGTGGQSLDDIVNQNAKMIRRQKVPQGYGSSPHHLNPDMRRISMMDYGAGSPAGSVGSFQYDPNSSFDHSGVASGGVTPAGAVQQPRQAQHNRRPSAADLALDTSFTNDSNNYHHSTMPPNSGYDTSPAHPNTAVEMNVDSDFHLDSGMAMNMDFSVNQNMNNMTQEPMQMNLYNQPQFNHSAQSSPLHQQAQQGTPQSGGMSSHDQGRQSQYGSVSGNNSSQPTMRQLSRTQSLHVPEHMSPAHGASPLSAPPTSGIGMSPAQRPAPQPTPPSFPKQPQNPPAGGPFDRGVGRNVGFDGINGPVPIDRTKINPNSQNFPWDTPDGGWPSTMMGKPHTSSIYKNAYSSTGFDMLGVLVRIFHPYS